MKKLSRFGQSVQLSFDNGRLSKATMASYPHYRIGDPLPEDKLIILEDTNNDGKADKQTNFADDLHILQVSKSLMMGLCFSEWKFSVFARH